MTDPSQLLQSAVRFAEEAGRVTLRHFGGHVASDSKADGTPVTIADREAESLLRERIGAAYPDHGILGEEFGEANADAEVRWILDPIDGTKSFMRGVPLYGVLIGIEVAGEPTVGVAHFPALSETVAAARGLGCTWNGRPAHVSECGVMSDALACATSIGQVITGVAPDSMQRVLGAAKVARGWGDCYGHILVATGRADVMVDPELSSWDAGPLLTIVTEAGGRFTDTSGNETIHGGSGISTNGRLHDEVLALFRGDRP